MELLAIGSRLRRLAIGAVCAAFLAPTAGGASDARGALRLAWRADLGHTLGRSLASAEGCVAVATRDRDCALLRLEDGATLWHVRRRAGASGGLALAPGTVLGVSDSPEGELFCLDRADGRERWRAALGEAWEPPAFSDTSVFAASVGGEVRCVSLRDGHTLWSYAAPAFVRARLVPVGDLVLVPTQGDSLIALEAASGEVRWGLAPGGALYGRIVVAGGRAWCVSYEGSLTAFDVHSGEVRERTTCEGLFRAGLAGPDPLLALATDGRLYALDPHSLEVLWQRELGAIGEVTPALDRELVWVGLQDGSVRALRARDGRDVTNLPVPAPIATPVVPIDGSVIIGAGGGEVVAYSWFGGRESSWGGAVQPALLPIGWSSGSRLLLLGPAAGPGFFAGPSSARGAMPDLGVRLGADRGTGRRPSRLARWAWTAGWVIGSVAALGMQREADAAYDEYRFLGRPEARDRAWDRAARYDRGVVAAWVASEACFALAVRAWLQVAPREGRAP
jgi:outer membrane protein assembly factor BamB